MADEQKTYLINIESNLDKYIVQAAEAKKKFDEMKRSVDELKAAKKTEGVEWETANAKLRESQKEYNEAKKQVDLQTQANNSNAESRKQLNAILELEKRRLGELANQYTINDKGQRVLSQAYLDGVKKVKDAKDAIIAYDKAQSDGRSSVGLYSEAIEGAMGKFQALPGPIGGAIGSIKSFGLALKALAMNPITLAITAIIGVFTALMKAIKSTDEGATNFRARLEQLKAIVDVLRQRLVGLADAIKHVFKGEWKEAGESFKQTFTGIAEQIRDATSAAWEYTQAMDALTNSEQNFISEAADIRNAIAKLEYTAQDRTKSTDERKKALQEAIRLGEQETDRLKEFARQRFELEAKYLAEKNGLRMEDVIAFTKMTDEEQANASDALKTLRNNNEAKLIEIEELYAKWIDADTKFYEQNKRNMSRLTGFEKAENDEREKNYLAMLKAKEEAEKEMEAAKKNLQKELDDYKKYIADQRQAEKDAEEERRQEKIEHDLWLKEQQLINQENLLAIQEQNNEYEFAIRRRQLEMDRKAEIDNAEQTGADVNLINQKYANAQVELTKLENESKLSLYGQFAGNIAQIFGKQTAVGKAAAVAQATIETYLSATKAFSSLANIPVVGPVLGAVAAAAAVAAGVANVKKILAVKSGLPGDSGGGGSVPTAVVASAPAQRTFAQNLGPTTLTQPQLTQQQINALPNQNALTAEDIAAAVSKLPAPKVTVEDINARQESSRKVEVRANI